MIRRYISYMPSNVWELPPVVDTVDSPNRRDEALATIVPKDRRKPYNMRNLVQMVVDKDSVFEIQPSYGKAVITSLARMNGKVVGIIANNPMIYGGALDLKAAAKQTHFIQLCDTFHIPLIFLVDVPGFMVGHRVVSSTPWQMDPPRSFCPAPAASRATPSAFCCIALP
jgi:acetyl-CoA carboxylase carboxyltransferase component